MGGVPCIRGLRIPVATVVGMLADGMSDPEILATAGHDAAHVRDYGLQASSSQTGSGFGGSR